MPSQTNVTIAGRSIGPDQPPYIVAEVSANHNGSLDTALRIVEAAAAAGADAVKLQTFTPDTLTIDHDGPEFRIEGGLWDGRTLYSLYEEAHMPWAWHGPLFAKAKELGITMFSTPFDGKAVDFLEAMDVPAYKIASFEVVDIPLIKKAASTGKPLIISTGLANEAEIEEAVTAAQSAGCSGLILLHCVSGYPTPVEESNLLTIPRIADRFKTPVGLSDHTVGADLSGVAVALGACLIEKHITLARAAGGLDAAFSIEPDELSALVSSARTAWTALGRATFDRKPSEAGNASLRRSLYITADIRKGEPLTHKNIRSIRPGYGLPPRHYTELLGKRVVKNVARGTPASWDIVESD